MVLVVKTLPAIVGDVRDVGSIPGSWRSPGGEHGSPLQSSCLENPMDRGACQAKVPGVTKESDVTEATFIVVQSLRCVQLFVTHGLQHSRLPCLSPSSGPCSNSCPLSL